MTGKFRHAIVASALLMGAGAVANAQDVDRTPDRVERDGGMDLGWLGLLGLGGLAGLMRNKRDHAYETSTSTSRA